GWRVMTKSAFTKHMEIAAAEAGLPRVHGYGLCIGAILEYLLRGLSLEQVKHTGQWSSDSFSLCLCQHAVILTLYLQNIP
ncbi:hypothetical protein M422DRAFT_107874, partial [Sphaerobolus stellatus SS14]